MTATASDATLEPPVKLGTSALPGYLALFASLFCAYGTESAYLPAFLQSHGLAIERIGTVLAAGTVVRIVAGPMLGGLADRVGTRRLVLAVAAALAGIIGSTYLVAWGFVPLLLVCMAHSAAEATLAPLSDALAVTASTARRGFQYGWVRGTGSAAFVGGHAPVGSTRRPLRAFRHHRREQRPIHRHGGMRDTGGRAATRCGAPSSRPFRRDVS